MSLERKIKQRAQRRKMRIRKTVRRSGFPRVSVFRSARHIYGQIIDDATGNTLASCSTLEVKNIEGDKKTIAHQIGLELARRAQEKGISKVAFDRGSFLYHGRVKALAEGLREGGLEI